MIRKSPRLIREFLVSGLIAVFQFGVEPFHRGFFCDDESLKHPLKSDTISIALAAGVGFSIPFAMILFIEVALRDGKSFYLLTPQNLYPRQRSLLCALYNSIGVFVFGNVVNQFLTEIGKNVVGRLRPHFLTVCQPDFSKFNCSDGYITASICTTKDLDVLKEARLSFPSGHSSFTAFCMLYIILYLEARVTIKEITLLKPVIQLALFCFTFVTCLTRISDYKHHWSDVLGGAILGLAVCLFVVFSLTDFGKFMSKRHVICLSSEMDAMNRIENSLPDTVKSHSVITQEEEIARAMPSELIRTKTGMKSCRLHHSESLVSNSVPALGLARSAWCVYCGSATVGTATIVTATVGTDTIGTATVGIATVCSATVGTATAGTATVGTATVGTAIVGTATFCTATVGIATVCSATVGFATV
ncbi:Phospholipid phosphatase 1, partial [Bulinus truncatus]